ncbi:hypothetical protein Pla163_32630 [Planctomycetes bacterium Pla163]|uniref:Uncharacterized protein n=1 Tax=Rohdeia mirabilis TaxID=2528008 RepID=A0A518D3T8_9BACT|nr:hypothetical protein Pla163_32630 [Planctomycetes bacterium Pla163]
MTSDGSSFDRPYFVAQGGFGRLREIGRVLSKVGIDSEIVGPPEGTNLNG